MPHIISISNWPLANRDFWVSWRQTCRMQKRKGKTVRHNIPPLIRSWFNLICQKTHSCRMRQCRSRRTPAGCKKTKTKLWILILPVHLVSSQKNAFIWMGISYWGSPPAVFPSGLPGTESKNDVFENLTSAPRCEVWIVSYRRLSSSQLEQTWLQLLGQKSHPVSFMQWACRLWSTSTDSVWSTGSHQQQ